MQIGRVSYISLECFVILEYINIMHGMDIVYPKSGAGKPYPEVTAAFLPSSLGNTHSFALGFSP